jgi:thymidylate synthase
MDQLVFSVQAKTLPDAWFQLVYGALDHGRKFLIDEGSYAGSHRFEFDFIVAHIEKPWLRDEDGYPLIPEIPEGMKIPPPVTHEYIAQYASYIMSDAKEGGESYTYGQRLRAARLSKLISFEMAKDHKNKIYKPQGHYLFSTKSAMSGEYDEIDQVDTVIKTYKDRGHRNNQMCMEIAQPTDMLLKDPPCLRSIDTRVQDNKLHFYIYFRSWDLWGGFPANLAGISLLQEYMATEIGVEPGEFICTSKGLHLYESCMDVALMRCHKDQLVQEGKND